MTGTKNALKLLLGFREVTSTVVHLQATKLWVYFPFSSMFQSHRDHHRSSCVLEHPSPNFSFVTQSICSARLLSAGLVFLLLLLLFVFPVFSSCKLQSNVARYIITFFFLKEEMFWRGSEGGVEQRGERNATHRDDREGKETEGRRGAFSAFLPSSQASYCTLLWCLRRVSEQTLRRLCNDEQDVTWSSVS